MSCVRSSGQADLLYSGSFKTILPYYEIIVLKSVTIGPQGLLPARKPLMAEVNSPSRYNCMSYIRASSAYTL
jgi:hypothetical protein